MPPVHIIAARQQNADTAGQTRRSGDNEAPGAPAPASPVEVLGVHFDSVFSGGLHPESVGPLLANVNTDIERGTDSVLGRLGGLVPQRGSVVAPGPAAGAAAAQRQKIIGLGGLPARIVTAFKKPPDG